LGPVDHSGYWIEKVVIPIWPGHGERARSSVVYIDH